MRREAAPKIMKMFAEVERQQKERDDELAASLRMEEAEEAKMATAAAQGCGGRRGRKEKEKEKVHGGGKGATTRLKSVHPRAESMR